MAAPVYSSNGLKNCTVNSWARNMTSGTDTIIVTVTFLKLVMYTLVKGGRVDQTA